MDSNILKNSRPKQLFIRFADNVKQSGCKATIITCGDTITKLPKENCCRNVPGDAEARKIVADMKETSLYTGNNDAIATSLASVS